MNRSLQRLSAWVLFLSLVLSMATGSAQATSSLSVDLRYTCSTSMPHTGSTLFFELSGTGTVDYCVMVVSPDSQQTFLYGANSSYTITMPGTYAIIGYGANSTNSSAPNFARCMTAPLYISAEAAAESTPAPELEPESWTMAYVDRIAYPEGDLYLPLKRWLSPTPGYLSTTLGYDADDLSNSGYLMLNYLLDNEYDYETARMLFPWYEGIIGALKLDISKAISTAVQAGADGYGAQVFTSALQQSGSYFVNDLVTAAQALAGIETSKQDLDDAFFELVGYGDTLNDNLLEGLSEQTLIELKKSFGRNNSDARKAFEEMMRTNNLSHIELSHWGVEFLPSGKVRMKFTDDSATHLYDALARHNLLNTDAGKRFNDAYQKIVTAQRNVNISQVAQKTASVLSAFELIQSTWKTKHTYNQEKQLAIDWLLLMAHASDNYLKILLETINSPYVTDQMKRGYTRYYIQIETALNEQLITYANNLDQLAHDMAMTQTAGEVAATVYKAAEFFIDVFTGAGLLELISVQAGVATSTLSKAQLVMLAVEIAASIGEYALENTFHIRESFEAAETMYAFQQLIIVNINLINQHLDLYTQNPTETEALFIIDLLRHHRTLKYAGENAAWAFINIDLADAIKKVYEARRDKYISLLWKKHPVSMLAFVGSPEHTVTLVYLILVNGVQTSVSSYYDLAQLVNQHGISAISLQNPSNHSQIIPLSSNRDLTDLITDTIDIINITSEPFRSQFDETRKWIDSLYIP